MKRSLLTTGVLAALVLLSVQAGAAPLVDASASLWVKSKYVFRGATVTDGFVLQPEARLGVAGFFASVWGNMDLDDVNDRSWEFTELDYTLGWGFGLPLVSFQAGVIHYAYPDADGDTTELFAQGQVGVLLSPQLTLYQDIDAADGFYADAQISHGVPLEGFGSLEFRAGLGFGSDKHNAFYYAAPSGGFSDASLGAALNWEQLPFVTVSPFVAYYTLVGDPKDGVDALGGDTDGVVFGIGAHAGF